MLTGGSSPVRRNDTHPDFPSWTKAARRPLAGMPARGRMQVWTERAAPVSEIAVEPVATPGTHRSRCRNVHCLGSSLTTQTTSRSRGGLMLSLRRPAYAHNGIHALGEADSGFRVCVRPSSRMAHASPTASKSWGSSRRLTVGAACLGQRAPGLELPVAVKRLFA